MSRYDSNRRKLNTGESQRKDGKYMYRYIDGISGKRQAVYADTLPELREREKEIARDQDDHILTDNAIRKLTLNELFQTYMETIEISDSTRANYTRLWKNLVQNDIGNLKVVQVKVSHIKRFYAKLSREGYAKSTIRLIHAFLFPTLEMAVEDDIIRKNPAKNTCRNFGAEAEEKLAMTAEQQQRLLDFAEQSTTYNVYHPMLTVMFGTAVRCGEMIGLTWEDISVQDRTVRIDHQLIYKDFGDGYRFHISTPKTSAGVRVIPMTREVQKAFVRQKELNLMRGIDRDIEVDGCKGFVFTGKYGNPMMPSAVNNMLKNMVEAYNRGELKQAKNERRKASLLPHLSAHILRHTGCTRMAESGIDPKVLQYIMGHARIEITMDVYNHVADSSRVEKEMEKMEAKRQDAV